MTTSKESLDQLQKPGRIPLILAIGGESNDVVTPLACYRLMLDV